MKKISLLLFFIVFSIHAQEKKVTGVVTDTMGPLSWASVMIKGTDKGVETDLNGNYSINVKQGDILVFSFVGMKTAEKKVGASNKIDVVLQTEENVLEEVVITGITKTDKRLFTGASTKLKADDVKIEGLPDISRALEGKAAGVSVQSVSGTFGSSPKIQVRGATSIYGASKPLWVVDGVVMEDVVELGAGDLASGDPVTLISSAIAGLSAEDIESFEVLKDGSATSIYGARAMAGVIVITTKKGKAGTNSFSYSNETTYRFRPYYKDYNIMNSQEQMGFYSELKTAGWLQYAPTINARYSGVYGKMYKKLTTVDSNGNFVLPNTPKAKQQYLRKAELRNTNWFKLLFTPGLVQNHSIAWSSGTEKATYYASLSALIDPGYSLSSSVNRYTANFNTSFKVSDKLKFSILSNASYRKQKAPGALSQSTDIVRGEVKRDSDINPYMYALNTSRTLDPKAYYVRDYAPFNIFHELKNNFMDFNVVDLRIQSDINYKFNSQIELTALGALKYSNSNIDHHITEFSNLANSYRAMDSNAIRLANPLLYKDPNDPSANPISLLPKGGIYLRKNYSMLSYDFRTTASYKNTINDDHTVNVYAGMELNKTDRNANSMDGWGLQYSYGETPFYTTDYFKQGLENNNYYYDVYNTRYRNVAFFGNMTYSWKHKYTINGTYRYEGTNKLGKSRSARWLPTWNISGSWNVDREDFFEKLNPLSHLTLKASYSLTADRGPSWVTNSLADIRAKSPLRMFEGTRENGLIVASLENSELTYEKKKELNFGVDLGLLKDRINLVVDWYKRDNYDLIGSTITQGIGGEIVKFGNIAEMSSNGLEVALNTANIKTKNFSWNTSFVYSKLNNKVTKLDNYSRIMDLVIGRSVSKQGYPAGAMFSIPFKGLNDIGIPTFMDSEGNINTGNKIFLQDRDEEKVAFLEYSGTINPTDVGSLGNIFKYKNLSLNVFMTYSFGNVVRLNPVFRSEYSDLTATPKEFSNRWAVPGDEKRTNIPAVVTSRMLKNNNNLVNTYNLYNYSTERVAKGDFVRLKEISLGYDFDKDVLNNLKMSKFSLKLQLTNPFLLYYDKKLKGQDPEFLNSGGVAMPVPRQLTFSIKARL